MGRRKDGSQSKRRGKVSLPASVVGLSLSLGAGCAESTPADASTAPATSNVRALNLHEVEVSDVSLGSFRVFDREGSQVDQPVVIARGCGGGCRGCGGRGCGGCRGCRGCRGCGGGCGGCGVCVPWPICIY